MLIDKNIIDALKNQGIEPDIPQLDFIHKAIKIQPRKKNLLSRLVLLKQTSLSSGIYLWGKVGRGKTVILRNLYKQLNLKKAEFHYLDFMRLIHSKLKEYKGSKNPLNKVNSYFCSKYDVLLIDEFQVEDVADAMMLSNVIKAFLNNGIYLFLTSNAHPNDLYKNGLQREKFIEVMKFMQEKVEVFELQGEHDYRLRNIYEITKESHDSDSNKQIRSIIKLNFHIEENLSTFFEVNKRTFECIAENHDFLWVSFKNYFSQPTGADDFEEICNKYKWIFINDFSTLDDSNSDLIRRFIAFIDIAYNNKAKISFFYEGIKPNDIYKGETMSLLWGRCESRLIEMETNRYLTNKKN
jgi:cell division protein ZapE